MDQPLPQPGSVRKARERALATQNVSSVPPPLGMADRPPRRPPDAKTTPAPGPVDDSHWPLPGPDPPAGMESRWSQSHRDSLTLPIQVPKRRGPTTSDVSSLGEPLPSPFEGSPRQTVSSVGSIPDFPLPGGSFNFPAPPRKTALGPPPSSRRGMSSMYSSFSFVSPIPEESPRRVSPRPRSHESYASSAAIPETWGTGSPLPSPADSNSFFDDSVSDRSRDSTLEEFEDDIKLFFEGSPVNKKHVLPAPSEPPTGPIPPPPATLVPGNPSRNDNELRNTTPATFANHSSVVSQATIPNGTSSTLTPDAILRAYAAGSLSEPQSVAGGPLTSNRISHSQARRPESRQAGERGSMTSLPDMIRRATTLATMMDKGTRPGSRVGEAAPIPADPPTYSSGNEKNMTETNVSMTESRDEDSSMSDMLAAFPPPAQTPPRELGSRESMTAPEFWRNRSEYPPPPLSGTRSTSPFSPQQRSDVGKKRGRRCCGLPLWLFLLLIFLVICIIIVVIVVPVELLVVRKRNFKPDQNIDDCRKFLKCLNGGTNVVSPGSCSCICTNGFTGSDCSIAGSEGCTSTNLVSDNGKSMINDVTIGGALPPLIVDSEQTFAVPLSGAIIVGKVNGANLSCVGQNDLVRFNGQSVAGNAAAQVQAADAGLFEAQAADGGVFRDEAADADSVQAEVVVEVFPLVPTIIFIPDGRATIIIPLTTTGRSRPTSTPRITTRPNFTTSRGGFTTRPTATQTRSFRPTATFQTSIRTTPLRSTIRTTSIFRTSTSTRTSSLSTTTISMLTSASTSTTTISRLTSASTTTSASMTISVNVTTSSSSSLATPTPTNGFVVNDQVLDFSRVAVLYILQEENVEAAQTAQTSLGQFLNKPDPTVQEASDIDVGGRNRVNLDNLSVDVGSGPVGGKKASQPQ
ncbi:hypothetical protein CDD80_148 [Ophiocordyceps camponoti-rufipedis]|uniref:EGF-like domain-containing protein n=1 Tax=Ophiocordyceps camponoti-rufipedis TaxID=2004952 RepID=A0A2C5YKT6_9HYPO|nr:hypothetical protein CDD80_148 [Ophiocordyceps camponoti-rufipedis]